MPLSISEGAEIEKNKIASSSVWLTLLEVIFPEQPPIRLCLNNETVTWNEVVWNPAVFSLSGTSETKDAEIPSVSLSIFDVYRNIIPYLDDYSGGLGAIVNSYIVNSDYLVSLVIGSELMTNSDCEAALPTLGGESLGTVRSTVYHSWNVTYAYSGTHSVKMTKTDIYENSRCHFVSGEDCGLESGTVYKVSVMVYLPSGQSINKINLRYQDSESNSYTLDETTSTDTWVELTGTYLEDGSKKPIIIREQGGDTIGEFVYYDNFSIAEAAFNTYEAKNTFSILNCTVGSGSMVSFQLGSENLINRACPEHRYVKNHCRFHFKNELCKYTGSATACDRSLTNCRTLENSINFGGFPGIGQGGYLE
ncbi:hypothetical protein DRO30_01380 [Candidatus Bathyarchaeota archaeon]|nr:MAG: hypothetical protein DRO30_01380 [Candidatus Bathyarchaeota archaeon]